MKGNRSKLIVLFVCTVLFSGIVKAQDEMWDKSASSREHSHIQWFRDAKFGMFIHWGLYSELGGIWNGKRYYGSGEWIMHQAKIPFREYAAVAERFNPTGFNADEWAQLALDAGVKYMVITAKHHEGFAMYDSKVSDFTIVRSTPYKKDPMKALAEATRKRGIQFGFYYSQFIDWHEPDGGRNTWDFEESRKDYHKYYREKAIPQLKELLTGYGPLGIVWFDMPGGLTREQTQQFIDTLRVLQPTSLFSSRVGQGLGDYRDFGDSEVPPTPIDGAWESIYTHNDSWGYIEHDMNFKTPDQIITLLANVASKGGNLMLNVGPDGKGRIPEYSVAYLRETGKWLNINGESIYGTTAGFIPAQPWGVTTAKPGKLYLHVLDKPTDGKILVPGISVNVKSVTTLRENRSLTWKRNGTDVWIDLPKSSYDSPDEVLVLSYSGAEPAYQKDMPVTVSGSLSFNPVDAAFSVTYGNAQTKSLTFSHYFGDWKHENCVTGMRSVSDSVSFATRITHPGDYRVILEYACPQESAKQEGVLRVNGKSYLFRTLRTSEFEKGAPLMFIRHTVATISVEHPGPCSLSVAPLNNGRELFKLKRIILEPVKQIR